jgi:murein DD-endopeptidase MepM/ murein hydrolase activator NlpD
MEQGKRFDGLTVTAIGIIILMGLGLLRDAFFGGTSQPVTAAGQPARAAVQAPVLAGPGSSGTGGEKPKAARVVKNETINSDEIRPPYDQFIVTQGVHGAEYGHMAIDISAGKGATIHSPINGTVTKLYIDAWGNPSLTIENDRWAVEMLHGNFTVKVGDQVTIGQPVGTEGNHGETFDPMGRSCAGRDCGYHTHINVFDKKLGQNVNPLKLFNITY